MTPLRIKRQVRQYHAFFYLNLDLFALAHGNLYEHTWIDLAKKKNTLQIQLLSSPAWLFDLHDRSPQSMPVLDKAAVKIWEKPTRKKL